MKHRIIMVVLLIAGAVVAIAYFWRLGNGPEVLRLHGVVEIQEVHLGSKVGGRVEKVMVREGEIVETGEELVQFDPYDLEAQQKQWLASLQAAQADLDRLQVGLESEQEAAEAAVEAAKANLDRVKEGWRREEKEVARFDVLSATADFQYAELELSRIEDLYRQSAVAKSDYDLARANKVRAKEKLNSATARLEMMQKGGWEIEVEKYEADWKQAKANLAHLLATRYREIKSAQAKVDEMRARLEAVRISLEETVVKAPGKAFVEVVSVRKGDMVLPNQPIVRILQSDDLWVRVYVPETELGKLRLDQRVDVLVDSYPNKRFTGRIFHINSVAEFTPRNVQSEDERQYQVFGVKIRVDDTQGVFRAGMAAEVIVPLAAADE